MIKGGISEDNFNEKALELMEISEKINDTWRISEKESKKYLIKKQIVNIKKSTDSQSAEEIYSIEYHVAFHPSYQVPVLYFNACEDNGSLASLDDLSKIFVRDHDCPEYQQEIHQIISQADHPVLFKPFYMIHPCHNHEVLSKFPESKNFILTFLTIYGPYIHLKMDSKYEKFYIDEKN